MSCSVVYLKLLIFQFNSAGYFIFFTKIVLVMLTM